MLSCSLSERPIGITVPSEVGSDGCRSVGAVTCNFILFLILNCVFSFTESFILYCLLIFTGYQLMEFFCIITYNLAMKVKVKIKPVVTTPIYVCGHILS